jgi:anti-sigma regulatory factor (Ser/Thr protein kinase)
MATPVEPDVFADDQRRVLRLPPNRNRLKAARRFVCESLAQWGATPPEEAALLTSELVTNAIIHAGGEVEVRLRRDGTRALVEVHDHSAEPPKVLPLDRHRRGGNGMRIVDALARDWGVTQINDDGKIVWFEVPLPT